MDTFSEMVEAARQAKGWGVGKLAAHVGVLPDGRTFDGKQISLICQGKRSTYDSALVRRLVEVLDLDEALAYHLADVHPPVSVDVVRELLSRRIKEVAAGEGEFAARQAARRNRRRRPGTTPPAATTLVTVATIGGALFGPRADPLVSRGPLWTPAEAERRAA